MGEDSPVIGTPDQRLRVFASSTLQELAPTTRADVWIGWPDDPARPPEPLLATPANESRALFSPDGRFFLYESDESGTVEIYVRSHAGGAGRWQLSERGGAPPRWAADGRAVYFWSRAGLEPREVREEGNALVPGPISSFEIPRPVLRTEESGSALGDVGRVLLFPCASERTSRVTTTPVLDWNAELARRRGAAR